MRLSLGALLVIILAMYSCKKEAVNENIGNNNNSTNNNNNTPQTGITYPDSAVYSTSPTIYGRNILTMADNSVLSEPVNYTMAANLQTDAHLKVVFTNYPSPDTTFWGYSSVIGFSINSVDSVATISSIQSGNILMGVNFIANGHTGRCKIDIYENGTAITRTKHFTWQ